MTVQVHGSSFEIAGYGGTTRHRGRRIVRRRPAPAPRRLRDRQRQQSGRARRVGLLGGALIAFGLGRRSLSGVALAAVGGELLYRGISGHSHLSGTHLSHAFGKGSLERIKKRIPSDWCRRAGDRPGHYHREARRGVVSPMDRSEDAVQDRARYDRGDRPGTRAPLGRARPERTQDRLEYAGGRRQARQTGPLAVGRRCRYPQ